MKEIYLDNCATTKPDEKVIKEMLKALEVDYGNPSSLHSKGFEIEKLVKSYRKNIGEYLGVESKNIFFTSGGTESNNIAVQGVVEKNIKKGDHIITSRIEHPSILNIMKYYEAKGLRVTYLDVNNEGLISLDELEKSISKETILVSLMHVNNEIGSIQPICQVKNILKARKSQAWFHVDGVQALGKLNINLSDLDVDSYSISGHKIHGPKGIGILYLKDTLGLDPIIFGGNQEQGIRSGTENTPGILGIGKAIELIENRKDNVYDYILRLKKYMIENIRAEIDGVKINTPISENHSAYIVNISFANIKSEILLHYLEKDNIYVSTGSACSKGTKQSYTLKAIGLSNEEIEGAIRICLSEDIKIEDIDYFISKVKRAVEEIREITLR